MKLLCSFVICILSNSILQAQIPTYVPKMGLSGWWDLDANANDKSGNGNRGIEKGSIIYGHDRFLNPNSAFVGNGQSTISLKSQKLFPMSNSPRTVSIWVKNDPSYRGQFGQLFSYGNNSLGGRFGLFTNGHNIGIEMVNSSVTIPYPNDGDWHHFVVLYPEKGNGSHSFRMFLDGIENTTSIVNPVSKLNTKGNESNDIGSLFSSTSMIYPFVGSIDDIGLWFRTLSDAEIGELYKSYDKSKQTVEVKLYVNSISNDSVWEPKEYRESGSFSEVNNHHLHSIEILGYQDKLQIEILYGEFWNDTPSKMLYQADNVKLDGKIRLDYSDKNLEYGNYIIRIRKGRKILHEGTVTFFPAG